MDNVKSVIKKIGDATRRGRVTRREAQNNVLELSKELNEVNMNLQAVFMQLRYGARYCVMSENRSHRYLSYY